jgi:integrase
MPLKLVKRHGGDIWYLRGSVRGIRVDQSTGTSNERAAREVLVKTEAQLLERSVHGDTATRTFNEAAIVYMKAGGDKEFLPPILKRIGRKKLFEITQDLIDQTAEKLFPDGGPATRNRKVYTPISAVMHTAARKHWCPKPVIARPKQPKNRIRWISRADARKLIQHAAPHLKPLVLFLFSTGCRLSEALYLDWKQVDLEAGEVIFLDTKNGEDRTTPLPPEAIAALSALTKKEGAVFRTQKGLAYEDRGGAGGGQVKTAWAGMCRRAGIEDFSPHDCRHTFATWYLRMHRKDYAGLMKICGWKSLAMVMRYAHLEIEDVKPTIGNIWGNIGEAKRKRLKVVTDKAVAND